MSLNESIVEGATLTWFGELGYEVGHGPRLAPGEPAAERDSFGEVVLVGRLRGAIRRFGGAGPALPGEATACAFHIDSRATILHHHVVFFPIPRQGSL
jgi:type I restriction enzyme R subunit